MSSRPKLKRKLDKFKKIVVKEFAEKGSKVIEFEVFGSYTHRKKKNPSDIDVLVIIKKTTNMKYKYLQKLLYEINCRIQFQGDVDSYLLNGKSDKSRIPMISIVEKVRIKS